VPRACTVLYQPLHVHAEHPARGGPHVPLWKDLVAVGTPHKSRPVGGCACEGCEEVRRQRREVSQRNREAQVKRPPAERVLLPEVDPSEWEHLRPGFGIKPRA
jgi:hypothetical protein